MQGVRIGCFREFQNSIKDSVHALLELQIKEMELGGYTVWKQEIDHESGGAFRFDGLSRSVQSVKSKHGFKIFWLEEGQFISEDSLKTLTPTLREEESELWISANAMNSADPFSQRFIVPFQKELDKHGVYEDDLHYIVKINHSDNPWFPDVLEQERLYDLATLPRAMYDHVWEGAFNDTVDNAIIKAEWFDAAIDAHIKLGFKGQGVKITSHDPSDLGTDDKATVSRHGVVIDDAKLMAHGDVNAGCDWALDEALEYGADLFVWDADGMGTGLKRQVSDALKGKKVDFAAFHGSAEPDRPEATYEPVNTAKKQRTNRETFKNKRAQKYWALRDRFFRTYLAVGKNGEKGKYIDPDLLISINSGIEDIKLLRSEVCRIPRKFNAQGRIQIMTKEEMLRIKIQSPNLADALMMSEEDPDIPGESDEPLVFSSFFSK